MIFLNFTPVNSIYSDKWPDKKRGFSPPLFAEQTVNRSAEQRKWAVDHVFFSLIQGSALLCVQAAFASLINTEHLGAVSRLSRPIKLAAVSCFLLRCCAIAFDVLHSRGELKTPYTRAIPTRLYQLASVTDYVFTSALCLIEAFAFRQDALYGSFQTRFMTPSQRLVIHALFNISIGVYGILSLFSCGVNSAYLYRRMKSFKNYSAQNEILDSMRDLDRRFRKLPKRLSMQLTSGDYVSLNEDLLLFRRRDNPAARRALQRLISSTAKDLENRIAKPVLYPAPVSKSWAIRSQLLAMQSKPNVSSSELQTLIIQSQALDSPANSQAWKNETLALLQGKSLHNTPYQASKKWLGRFEEKLLSALRLFGNAYQPVSQKSFRPISSLKLLALSAAVDGEADLEKLEIAHLIKAEFFPGQDDKTLQALACTYVPSDFGQAELAKEMGFIQLWTHHRMLRPDIITYLDWHTLLMEKSNKAQHYRESLQAHFFSDTSNAKWSNLATLAGRDDVLARTGTTKSPELLAFTGRPIPEQGSPCPLAAIYVIQGNLKGLQNLHHKTPSTVVHGEGEVYATAPSLWAVKLNQKDILEWLIEIGCSVNCSYRGKTLADFTNNQQIRAILANAN